MAGKGRCCPVTLDSASDSSGTTCTFDEACVCANSSHVRELVNVSLEGQPCYACEPERLPACTEASDQCTPEACECGNSMTHVRQNATTVDGALCFYCEPRNGSWQFGRNEAIVVGILILMLVLWISGRRHATSARSTLRLPRRQGDRHRAIRVQQEPLRFYEEILLTVGDAFDALVDGAWSLVAWTWTKRGEPTSHNIYSIISPISRSFHQTFLGIWPWSWQRLGARQGQHNLVEALLKSRVEANAADPHGGSALLRAVESGGVQARPTIEALLTAKANPCQDNGAGESALASASSNGPAELLKALLAAAVHVPSPAALSAALAAAAAKGNRATAEILLDAGAPAANAPLHSWVGHADVGMVRHLAEKRANVNLAQGDDGETPLTRASRLSPEESAEQLVQLLCDLRADVNQPTSKALTPLAAASRAGAAKVVRRLLECKASVQPEGSSISPLVAASTAGSVLAAGLLLEAKAVPETADAAGRRPLGCAAATGNLKLCRLLLGTRADPNQRSRAGETSQGPGAAALAIAVSAGHKALVEELLAARADPEEVSERGQSPLMLAAALSRRDLCEELLAASAQPDGIDPEGKSALVLAAGAGCLPVCEVLLEARADLAQRTVAGACALDSAAANGHQVLLDARADLASVGPAGRTPAEVADFAGHASLAEMLRR
ncbi:ANKRD50 [Symbiodinium necroappetens]|uniref:ANKRD50 protein n=1 Tax=Symbiodinium necroappetens TaxID=1628268 RepID=A0A812SDL8_9DINO|nr:ANKRD50 [Symbiodinium necroappetens]